MDKKTMLANKRKERDIARLFSSKFKVNRDLEYKDTFLVDFDGPKETLYEGGHWQLRVFLPDNYPYKSPSVGFVNKIFHPNIDFGFP